MKRLKKLRVQRHLQGAFHEKYLVITNGVPFGDDQKEEILDVTLEQAGYKLKTFRGKQAYEPVIYRELTKRSQFIDRQRGKHLKTKDGVPQREIKRVSVRRETLSKSEGAHAALVSV